MGVGGGGRYLRENTEGVRETPQKKNEGKKMPFISLRGNGEAKERGEQEAQRAVQASEHKRKTHPCSPFFPYRLRPSPNFHVPTLHTLILETLHCTKITNSD